MHSLNGCNISYTFSDLIANLSVHQNQFPSSEDFRGAAFALGRLQDTYSLTTAAIARGQVGNGSLLLTSKSHCDRNYRRADRYRSILMISLMYKLIA